MVVFVLFLRSGARQQKVEQSLLGGVFGFDAHLAGFFVADHDHCQVYQIADHALDVTPNVADFGEFTCFDLDEGCLGQFGQPSGDFSFADPGGTDHDDVLRYDLIAQFGGHLLAPPAVTQGDGHRTFGVVLADDMTIEFGDDLAWSEVGHGRLSEAM